MGTYFYGVITVKPWYYNYFSTRYAVYMQLSSKDTDLLLQVKLINVFKNQRRLSSIYSFTWNKCGNVM